MRAIESPRRCKCDECRGTDSLLFELELFETKGASRETKKDAIVVAE